MVTIGADPELFLQQGEFHRSAIGVIPGTKSAPFHTKVGAFHVDNVAAELNVLPSSSEEEFVMNVGRILGVVRNTVFRRGFVLSKEHVAQFLVEDLIHPMAQEAGCEADFNAYSEDPNIPNTPKTYVNTQLRVAGGHIHVGYNGEQIDTIQLIKAMDVFVTLPMLAKEDKRRRELYGQAGDFRWKPYGAEYRTPSNAWVMSRERARWAYQQAILAVNKHKECPNIAGIQEIINQHDVPYAEKLCDSLGITRMPE